MNSEKIISPEPVRPLAEEAYSVLDRLDEKMIGSELAGLVEYGAQELIYSFKIDGREVTGLSWPGAKALARWMAEKGHPLDAVEKEITQDEEEWYADVKIIDKETGLGLWGTSKAKKMKEIHVVDENRSWVKNPDGTWKTVEKPDGFARTIALNKAQRNAILSHVPDKMIAQFIKQAIDEGKVRKVPPEEVEVTPKEKPNHSLREMGASEALSRAGIDPELVEIRLENGTVNVYPTRGLVDWAAAKTALAVAGFAWAPDKQRWSRN